MVKRNVMMVLIILIGVVGISVAGVEAVRAQDGTVPTRTPTPDPNRPTTQPSPTATRDGTGNPPGPTATQTASSPAAPTSTGTRQTGGTAGAPVTPSTDTVTGGTLQPGAGLPGNCDETPYVRVISQLTAHTGPGIDYEPIATLEPAEMRRIIGRAADATWWQIQLDAATVGWVQDRDVDEFGNTALVIVVETPPRNGATTTPGAPWNPTPLPLLTCVPTPTPSATPIGTQTPPTAAPDNGTGATGPGTSDEQPAGATSESAAGETNGGAAIQEGAELPSGPGVSSRGSESSRAASPTSAVNLILPIAGLALIGGGILLALLSRNRGGKQDTPPQ